MVSRASNIEAVNRQLDIGSQGSELHAVIKARQWTGAASLINGSQLYPARQLRAICAAQVVVTHVLRDLVQHLERQLRIIGLD